MLASTPLSGMTNNDTFTLEHNKFAVGCNLSLMLLFARLNIVNVTLWLLNVYYRLTSVLYVICAHAPRTLCHY